MRTGGNGVSSEALGDEFEYSRDLLACHVELLHDLLDAEVLQVLDDGGDGEPCTLNTQAPLTLPGMLSTAGHWDQSSAAMVGTPHSSLRQLASLVTSGLTPPAAVPQPA